MLHSRGEDVAKGIRFARFVKARAVAGLEMKKGVLVAPLDIAKAMYPKDAVLHEILTKANVTAGGTNATHHWGSQLVGTETAMFADFVEWLRPQTIVGRFGMGGIPALRQVPFRTALVGQTSGGAGYWVGESQPKPLTKFDFTRTTLAPLKVANIAVITMELLRDSSPSAETIVRDQLGAALRERTDIDFIDPAKAAVAGVSPASITQGIVAIPSSGNQLAAIEADVAELFAAFIAANNPPTSGVWIMSATTALRLSMVRTELGNYAFPNISMSGGTFFNLPVIVSEHVPVDTAGGYVMLVNASDIYFADDGEVAVDMSQEASPPDARQSHQRLRQPAGGHVAGVAVADQQRRLPRRAHAELGAPPHQRGGRAQRRPLGRAGQSVMRLIADKRVTYAGRVYRPGVAFSARAADARVLVVQGKARFAPALRCLQPAETPASRVGALRTAYEERAGKAPDLRWGEKRLAQEIEAL